MPPGWRIRSDDWTWDEFLATAKALTLDLDGDGVTDQYGLGTEASIFRVAPFIWQNGGELVVGAGGGPSAWRSTHGPRVRRSSGSWTSRPSMAWCPTRSPRRPRTPRAASSTAGRRCSSTAVAACPTCASHRRLRLGCGGAAGARAGPAGILHSDAYCMAAATPGQGGGLDVHRVRQLARGPGDRGATRAARCRRSSRWPSSDAFLDPTQKPANSRVWLDTIPTRCARCR